MSVPRRVVLYCHTARAGGAELAAPMLARTLEADLWSRGVGLSTATAESLGVTVRVLDKSVDSRPRSTRERVKAFLSLIALQAQMFKSLMRNKPSLVVSNSLQGSLHLGLAAFLTRTPLVVYVRDLGRGGNRPRAEVVVYEALLRMCAAGVVFNSETTRRSWRVNLPGIVVPTAVDQRFFDLQPSPARSGVVMIGRIAAWKGQPQVVSALNMLSNKRPDIHLTLVGERTFEDDVALPNAKFDLRMTGFVDPSEPLRQHAVLVHASVTAEPFGQVLAQAAASGIPIVCANEGGHTEWLQHGVSCLMVDPTDVEELSAAIDRALSDKSESDERASRARSAAQRFRANAAYKPLSDWLEAFEKNA